MSSRGESSKRKTRSQAKAETPDRDYMEYLRLLQASPSSPSESPPHPVPKREPEPEVKQETGGETFSSMPVSNWEEMKQFQLALHKDTKKEIRKRTNALEAKIIDLNEEFQSLRKD